MTKGHNHPVTDGDNKHFVIDPVTRSITNNTSKLTLTQKDHNSERYTFEIPQDVEGHDMSLCNKIEIHFVNIDSKTREKKIGIYEVDDVQKAISEETGEKILTFTWLVSGAATECMGTLSFAVRFACVDDETSAITYSWNTAIHSNINILESIYNSESLVAEYYDVLQQWLSRIEKSIPTISANGYWTIDGKETDILATPPIPEIGANGNWFVNGVDTGTRAGGTPGSILMSQVLKGTDEDGNNIYEQTYSNPDGTDTKFEFIANRGPEGKTGDTGPEGKQGIQGDQGIQGLPGKDGEQGREALLCAYVYEYKEGDTLIGAQATIENYEEYFNREPVNGDIFYMMASDISIFLPDWPGATMMLTAEITDTSNLPAVTFRTKRGVPILGKQGDPGLPALSCIYVEELELVNPENPEEGFNLSGAISQVQAHFNRLPEVGDLFNMNAYYDSEVGRLSYTLSCKVDSHSELEPNTILYTITDYVEITGPQGPKGDTVSSVLYYTTEKDFGSSEPSSGQLDIGNFSRNAIVVNEYFVLLAKATINDVPRTWLLNCRVAAVGSTTVTYEIRGSIETTGRQGPMGPNGVSCTHSWNGKELIITSASGTSSADLQGPKGESIQSIDYESTDADGNNVYNVTLTNGTKLESTITAPKGERGYGVSGIVYDFTDDSGTKFYKLVLEDGTTISSPIQVPGGRSIELITIEEVSG